MIQLKEIKKLFFRYRGRRKGESSNERFLSHFFVKDEDGMTPISFFNASKISKLMNGKVLPASDYKVFLDYFNREESRMHIFNLSRDIAHNANINILKQELKKMLASDHDFLMKKLYGILEIAMDENTIALVLKWMIIFGFLQKESSQMEMYYNTELNGYEKIKKGSEAEESDVRQYLLTKGIIQNDTGMRICAEVPFECYYTLRKSLIDNACGTLYIAGETLTDAFSVAYNTRSMSIIENLVRAINEKRVDRIRIYIVDPSVFKDNIDVEPLEMLRTAINNIIVQLQRPLDLNHCKMEIYFVPFLDIDHAVISDRYMLFRSTKLWTNQRDYKGSIMIYNDYILPSEEKNENRGEYFVHKKYLDTLAQNSVEINTAVQYPTGDGILKDMQIHGEVRNAVFHLKQNKNTSIDLYKLYDSQLYHYAISSFMIDRSRFTFNFNKMFESKKDLFDAQNLLGDRTQRVLLPYISETEELLNKVVKRYDKRPESGAVIIPSLDLGYPNNVMRLAGGFATGMLIDWECGTPIVPIDATVNVCSSSVFKIKPNSKMLKDFERAVEDACNIAVKNCGYSFSFSSGNHFLMLALDERNEYYLVLHSSAKELKESYLGLYPKEENWYSGKVKQFNGHNRYIRYIKGDEAKYFIQTAHHIEKYNEEIHRWLSIYFNGGNTPEESIIKHHYYMPTDSSIAIGTFVEHPGEVVPLFSDVGKPVYLFRIAEDNWTYNLGGNKGSVCIVPHGWGQQIENVGKIINEGSKLKFACDDGNIVAYNNVSTERIDEQLCKRIRDLENGEDFLKKGKKFLKGSIEKTLTPHFLYCQKFIGKMRDY